MTGGGFYDPYGYFFDEDGLDDNYGKYDAEGIYRTAEEHDEEIGQNSDEEDKDG